MTSTTQGPAPTTGAGPDPHYGHHRLTERHIEILNHIANGRTSQQIAHLLGLTVYGVNTTIGRIYRILGAHDRAHAVALAARHHLIDLTAVTRADGRPPAPSPALSRRGGRVRHDIAYLLKQHGAGISDRDIARRLRVDRRIVSRARSALDIPAYSRGAKAARAAPGSRETAGRTRTSQ